MIILQLSDFIDGKYNLPAASSQISANNTEVQSYINNYEEDYIYQLLGVELGKLVIAYIQANGTGNTDYDKIINPFAENYLLCGQVNKSLGLKQFLQACIWYEYKKDSAYVESLAGTVKLSAEVSTQVSASAIVRTAERVFNSVLRTADAIQYICNSNTTAYAGYNGKRMVVKGHQFFL